jgi:hypothetical protein
MPEPIKIPVSESVQKQNWRDAETSEGRGLDSVTEYKRFFVWIDNSPEMPFIWLEVNTGFDSTTYWYEEYPKVTPLSLIKTDGLRIVDKLIAEPKLMLMW